MKCPYCHIHYMDDERECPMCGTRNPQYKTISGKKEQTKKNKPIKYSVPKNISSGSKSSVKPEKSQKKKENWGKIFAVLLVIIPVISNIVFGFIDYRKGMIGFSDASDLEQLAETANSSIAGTWVCDETGEVLTLSIEDLEYTLYTSDDTKHGNMQIIEDSVHLDEDGQEVHFYQVDFYSEDVYVYSLLVMGAEQGQVIVTMPYEEGNLHPEKQQVWRSQQNTDI